MTEQSRAAPATKTLRTQRIELTGKDGRGRVVLGVQDDGNAGVFIADKSDNTRAVLVVAPDGTAEPGFVGASQTGGIRLSINAEGTPLTDAG